jgi:hypothetical protein
MNYRFGKHAPKNDYRTFLYPNYNVAMPSAPAAYDSLSRVLKNSAVTSMFPMDGNDVEGCCTIAGRAHCLTLFEGFIGKKSIPTKAQVHKLYRHLSGGEDTGLNMLDVLNDWRKNPFNGEILDGFAKLKVHNHDHVKQAIAFFGCVYLGFQCQEDVLTDFNAKKVWTPGKLTEDGHCVVATGYDADTIEVLTWAARQKGTWDWWDTCVDEAYILLPKEAETKGFAPGFNFTQLKTDLAAVAS